MGAPWTFVTTVVGLQRLRAADVGGLLSSPPGGISEGNSATGTSEDETSTELTTWQICNGHRINRAILRGGFCSRAFCCGNWRCDDFLPDRVLVVNIQQTMRHVGSVQPYNIFNYNM